MWTLIAITALSACLLALPLSTPRAGEAHAGRVDRWALGFAVVCLLLYLNQVAFQVYVYEEHGGSTDFIGVRGSWFFQGMAPDHPPVAWLRAHLEDASWLAPSVLRVQAVLELPFALFAYLSVAGLVDRAAARQIAAGPLGLLACVAYSVVLSAIEVLLWNPYTVDDLWLRGISCVGTAILTRRMAGPPVRSDPPSLARLLLFGMGLGAMGLLVMGVNLIALLYNLGWISRYGPAMVGAAALYGAVLLSLGRVEGESGSWLLRTLFAFGRRFTLIFAAPALAIRYGMTHPRSEGVSYAVLGLCLVAALGLGAWEQGRDLGPGARWRWALRLASGIGAGLVAAQVDLAALLGLPLLGVSDLWFVQKGALLALGFVLGWGAAALLSGRPPDPRAAG